MDVHVTRDDHLVVVHDDNAQRTTGARFAWTELTLADVQRLDAGWGFVAKDGSRPFAGQGIRIPTFEEVLLAFPDVLINVDLKGPRATAAMLAVLERHPRSAERVTLAAFQI